MRGSVMVRGPSACGLLFGLLGCLLVLPMNVLQIQVHVIEDLLLRHLKASERLLQMHDLRTLTKQELPKRPHLAPREQYIPINNRIRLIRQARNLKLLNYFSLHIGARVAYWVYCESSPSLRLTIPDILSCLRYLESIIMHSAVTKLPIDPWQWRLLSLYIYRLWESHCHASLTSLKLIH